MKLSLLLEALRQRYCNMNYSEFLERTGFNEDQYSLEKFSTFQEASRNLLEFDEKTLEKILGGE
ncbi:MAG: hypothetical protein J7525_19795 [Roseofilum sp. SID3]|uniref:hypothetical protein n=1 Tax=Roseofilum sp. SID3 TaxID=2821499 RepID=UPI001B0C5D57|nr:hypothetical protein [Roseofilum sp. SID3]MBP0015340.1 hypothetical protein [Roseofilum sp. SID3]